MTSLIEKIKGPRTLTFNHWRYRLLHWTFAVNPKNASDSPLPHPLYTHYCPLFWLTNLFVLTAVPLALWRGVLWPILQVVGWFCTPLLWFLVALLGWLKAIGNIELSLPDLTTEEQRLAKRKNQERKLIWQEVWNNLQNNTRYTDWELYWTHVKYNFSWLNEEEAKQVFDSCVAEFRETEEDRKRAAERFAKLVAFARVATMVAFYGIAAGALIGVAFLLYFGVPWLIGQVVTFFNWAATWPWVDIGIIVAILTSSVVSIVGIAAFATWIKLGRKIGATGEAIGGFLGPKVAAAGSFLAWPFVMGWRGIDATAEFIVELYANSCPPITIVDDRTDVVFEGYINAVMDYLNGDVEADSKLMASVEKHIGEEGIPEQGVDDYRRTLAAFIGNLATKNVEFTPHSHPDLFQAIQRKIASDDEAEQLEEALKQVKARSHISLDEVVA